MWTRIKSRLMGQKQAPEVADETEDSWRQHISRSRKDSPMTASGSSCNTPPGKMKPRSKSKTRFFSFGRASMKKKNSFDESLLTINQTHLDATDNTCEQEIEKFLQDVVDFKPVDEQHGPEVVKVKTTGRDVADSAIAPDNETKFEAVFCGRKSNADRLKRSEANVVESPVWIHRIWDDDGDDDDDEEDERNASIAAASDLNDGATGPLTAAGDKALLVRECSGGVTGVSPPRMKRRKKPAPPIRVESRKSRLASNQTSPTNHVVPTSGCETPGIPPDMFSVDLDKRLDSVDSLLTDSLSINLSPSPVVGVRSFPEVTSGFSEVTSGFELKEMTDKDFLFNCPEYATCDELDGKESGYVTLEEFHAKFMNDIDGNFMNDIVSQTDSVSQTDNLGRTDNVSRSHIVDTENKESLELRYPTLPFAISDPAKSVAIVDPGTLVDVPGATKDQARMTGDIEKPSTSASDPSSVLRLTFTVKLESRMFQRRQGQKLKQLRSSEVADDLSDQQTHAVPKPPLCSNCFESRVGVEDNVSASRDINTPLTRFGKLSPPPMATDNQSQLKLDEDNSSTLAVLQSSLEISVDGSSGKIESLPLPIGSDVIDSDSKDDRNVLTQTFQVQLPASGGDESRACNQYRELFSSPAESSQGTSVTLKSNCHASSPTDIASNILANNDRNKSLEFEREYDFGEDEILEITEDDDGSYLHPLTTRNYENRPSDGIQQLASNKILLPQTCKTTSDSEQTHMNWGEVLEEAEILGIPLHPPNVALSCSESDKRSSKSSSISSVTREFGQSSPVINGQVTSARKHVRGGQSGEQSGTNTNVVGKKIEKVGRDKEQSRSKSSSSVLRDMFKLQNIFSRSNKENRNKTRSSESDSPVTNQRRYRTSRSPGTRSNIQSRTLPPVPADGELHDSCCSAPFDRTYNVSRSSFGSGTSRPESSSPCPRSPLSPTCRVQGSFPRKSARSVSTSRDYFPDDFGRSICSSGSIPLSYRGAGMCFSPSTSSFGSVFSSCSRGSPCTGSRLVPPASAPIDTVDARRLFMPGRSRSNQNDIAQSFGQLQNAAWYWGSIGFEVAEAKLANRPDGTFLVRDSTDDRYILSLSFRSAGTTHHTRIEHYKGIFSFYSQPKPPGGATTIVEFIETAMAASKSGQCLYYLQPRGPGQPPAPVRLVYPLSRFRCMHSLQHLCKFAVLRHVRLDMIDRLPIPPRLKEYLKHSQCQGRSQLQNKE